MGHELVVVYYPWSRGIEYVKRNHAFGIFPMIITQKRKKAFLVSSTIGHETVKFFYYHESMAHVTWSEFGDLKKYRIGGTQHYSTTILLSDAGLKLDISPMEESGFKKLKIGRLDLFPSSELVGRKIINKLFPLEAANFKTLKKSIKKNAYAVMCSKKHPDNEKFLKMFNEGLIRIKKKGVYEQILISYGLEE